MVLDNSTAPDSFDESPPSSDYDTYSSSDGSTSTQTYNIDASNMPKPFPLIGPAFGYNEKFVRLAFTGRTQGATAILQRNLNHDEVTALYYWTSKQVSIMSWAPILGISSGLWRAQNTADRFRFPMFQPNLETFNKDVFPHPRFPYIQGIRAVAVWHLTRAFWYAAAGNFIAKFFVGSYAMTVATVGEMSDPRLKDYILQLRQRTQQKQGRLPRAQGSKQGLGQTRPVLQEGEIQDQDDASPTSEMYTEEDFQQSRSAVPTKTSPPLDQTPQIQEKTFDFFDDAERGKSENPGASRVPPPPQQRGSAWDRLRKGQGPQTRQDSWDKQQREAQHQKNGEANFTPMSAREQKQYGKQDAQAEFDARVEKERKGGDFSIGSGDQKRW